MKFSRTDALLIKNLYLSKRYGGRTLLSEFPDHVETWKQQQSAKENCKTGTIVRQPRSGIDRVQRVAVEDVVFSQVDKPKRHRSARETLHETSIPRSSVHRIIHRNLQLKCFKRHHAQLLSEANRISRVTRW